MGMERSCRFLMRAFILCSLIGLSQQRCRLKTTCVNSRISALIIGWMQHDRTVSSSRICDFPSFESKRHFCPSRRCIARTSLRALYCLRSSRQPLRQVYPSESLTMR